MATLFVVAFQKTVPGGVPVGAFALTVAKDAPEAEKVVKRMSGVLPETVHAKDFYHDKVLAVFEGSSVIPWPAPSPSEKAFEGLSKEPKTF